MRKPAKYTKKPVTVDAMQFLGWQNAFEIFRWCGNVFYVGRGSEHSLREEREFDRGNGHILEQASEFLVLRIKDEDFVRINVRDWIVFDEFGLFSRVEHQNFSAIYNEGIS